MKVYESNFHVINFFFNLFTFKQIYIFFLKQSLILIYLCYLCIEEVVERAQQSFSEGVCELWLTSEDTGTYGRDIGSSLPELLWKIIDVIPPNCMMRVGMTNPPYILEHLEVCFLCCIFMRFINFE